MYNTAYRILNDSFEAEDIMQESFLTAFSKLNTFNAKSKYGDDHVPFGSWLKRIVVNKSLTQLKKIEKISFIENKQDRLENLSIAEDTNKQTTYNKLKANEIIEAINQLKPNYKIALQLSLIEGYDNEEIAQILNTSNQNIRTTISRAKRKLKLELQLYSNEK